MEEHLTGWVRRPSDQRSIDSEHAETPPFDVQRFEAENQRIRDIGYRIYRNRLAQQLVGETIVEAR